MHINCLVQCIEISTFQLRLAIISHWEYVPPVKDPDRTWRFSLSKRLITSSTIGSRQPTVDHPATEVFWGNSLQLSHCAWRTDNSKKHFLFCNSQHKSGFEKRTQMSGQKTQLPFVHLSDLAPRFDHPLGTSVPGLG